MSVNIGKYVSTKSLRTFIEIQELMSDYFLFKDFMTFFISLDDTSFKSNFLAILCFFSFFFFDTHVIFTVDQ